MLSESSRVSGEDSRRLEARATLAECLSSRSTQAMIFRAPLQPELNPSLEEKPYTKSTSLLAFSGLQEHLQGPVAVSVATV